MDRFTQQEVPNELLSGEFLWWIVCSVGIQSFSKSVMDYILDAMRPPFNSRTPRTFRSSSTSDAVHEANSFEEMPATPSKTFRAHCSRASQAIIHLHKQMVQVAKCCSIRYILLPVLRELGRGNSQFVVTTLVNFVDAWIQKDKKFSETVIVTLIVPHAFHCLTLLAKKSNSQPKPSQSQLTAFQDLLMLMKGLLERHRLSQQSVVQHFVIEHNHLFRLLTEDTPFPDRNMLMQVLSFLFDLPSLLFFFF
jgi:hypothetical protein